MSPHVLTFDLTAHDLLNSNHRLHWSEERRRSRRLRDTARWVASQAGVPRMGRAHVVATVHWPDRRRRDAHNLGPTFKRLIDGIVDAGVLPDDNDKFLTGPDPRSAPAPLPRSQWLMRGHVTTYRVVLEITDIGEEVPHA